MRCISARYERLSSQWRRLRGALWGSAQPICYRLPLNTHKHRLTHIYAHIWLHTNYTHTRTNSLQLQFVLICARRWEGGQSDTDGWTAVWTECERKNEGRKETGLTVKCIHYSCGNKCLVRNRGDITIHQPACPPPPPPPPLVTGTGVCNFPFLFLLLLLSFSYCPPVFPPSIESFILLVQLLFSLLFWHLVTEPSSSLHHGNHHCFWQSIVKSLVASVIHLSLCQHVDLLFLLLSDFERTSLLSVEIIGRCSR